MYPEERSLVKEMQGRPFVLLGVNTDETATIARKAVQKNKLNWRSFFDGKTRNITGQFRIRGFPTVMLVNHHGQIEHRNIRGQGLHDEIQRLVEEAEADGMEGDKIAPRMRTFRDRTGEYRIEAMVDARDNDRVRLQKKAGGSVVIALEDLSRADQDYLRTVDIPQVDLGQESATSLTDDGSATDSGFRTFVDSTGKYRVEARFVRLENGVVTLEKRDGETIELPLERLSEDDQLFINRKR